MQVNPCENPEIMLSCKEITWKGLMKECLIETDILKKKENHNEKYLYMDPNSVMDLRHKMIKECVKILRIPQIQIHCDALRLIRLKNNKNMVKQKEERLVEKEIARLRQTLENNRLEMQKRLKETTSTKTKFPGNKYALSCIKQWKRNEFCDGICKVDSWLHSSFQMEIEPEISVQEIPVDVTVTLNSRNSSEEFLEPAPTLEGSVTDEYVENFNEVSETETKNVFHQNRQLDNEKQQSQFGKFEVVERIPIIQNKMNLRRLQHAWLIWRVYIEEMKNMKSEKKNYKTKIDAFLSKLEKKKMGETRAIMSTTPDLIINNRLNSRAKARNNHLASGRREKHLKDLMTEVKTSQAEAYQRLQEIRKARVKNEENLTFLRKMEERREESLKRRSKIQERKEKLEEVKKMAETLKEDEKKREEEEKRRKKLEELKEKRRLEIEKKKEEERAKEKLREKMKMAENHSRKYFLLAYGLRPWLMFMKMSRGQQQKAVVFFEEKLMRNIFGQLRVNVREQTEMKVRCAEEFQKRMLKKNFLLIWLDFYKKNVQQQQVAMDWNDFRITERAFKKWLLFTQDELIEYLNKKHVAGLNYERKVKMKYFKKLRDYPELKKMEQAKENRKRKWREKVREILPDYQPAEITDIEKLTQIRVVY